MKRKPLWLLLASLGMAISGGAQAAISGGVVKIGVLNDMSGPYADATGPGSVVAAQMAAEDYVKDGVQNSLWTAFARDGAGA